MSKGSLLTSVMFSKPWGLFESRSIAVTPSSLRNFVRAFAASSSAANGEGAGGSPYAGGGPCIGRRTGHRTFLRRGDKVFGPRITTESPLLLSLGLPQYPLFFSPASTTAPTNSHLSAHRP